MIRLSSVEKYSIRIILIILNKQKNTVKCYRKWKRADDYINNSNVVVYGYKCEGAICGLIVLDITKKEKILILDIVVGKGNQHAGIPRKLVEYALYNLKPNIKILSCSKNELYGAFLLGKHHDKLWSITIEAKELAWDVVTKHAKTAGKVGEYSAYNIVTCS